MSTALIYFVYIYKHKVKVKTHPQLSLKDKEASKGDCEEASVCFTQDVVLLLVLSFQFYRFCLFPPFKMLKNMAYFYVF